VPDATNDDGLPALARQLGQLVVTYLKQETVEPAKGLARFVALGVAGSFALGLGLVLLAVAGLRALQEQAGSTFSAHWSWAPYGIVAAAVVIITIFAVTAIGRGRTSRGR